MLKLLVTVAETGQAVCDTHEMRKLWYAGLVSWCSPTEVCLTSAGLAVLYRAEEQGDLDG